jgi:hypothetical protein
MNSVSPGTGVNLPVFQVKRVLDVVISMTAILFLPRLLSSSIAAASSSSGPQSF